MPSNTFGTHQAAYLPEDMIQHDVRSGTEVRGQAGTRLPNLETVDFEGWEPAAARLSTSSPSLLPQSSTVMCHCAYLVQKSVLPQQPSMHGTYF